MEDITIHTGSRHILFCRCGGERIDGGLMASVESFLKDSKVPVTVFSDLCGLAARKKDVLAEVFSADKDYLVIGCYHRTMNLLFSQVPRIPIVLHTEHINLIEEPKELVLEKIMNFSEDYTGEPQYLELTEDSGWPSWYPVIDQTRCTRCGQCADFCLFGVYDKTDEGILVVNPEGCKNNCPACARLCPSAAIVFPKYADGGAIGGSEAFDEQEEQQRQVKDVELMLGNDLYSALEKRKAKRKSIIREATMAKALAEREQAKTDIQLN